MPNTNIPGNIAQKASTVIAGSATQGTLNQPAIPATTPVIITKFQFRKLFTLQERMAIDNAQYNTTLTGSQKAAIYTMQKDMEVSVEVDLHMADTITGINFLVSCYLLTADRASRILNNLPPL